MGAPVGSKRIEGQLSATSATYLTGFEGPVMLAYGASKLRCTGFLRDIVGGCAIKPRYRKIAVRPDAPDGTITEGTAVTTEVTGGFSQDFSLTSLGAFMFVQPLLGKAATTGAGECYAMMQSWTDTVARVVARQTFVVTPSTNTSQTQILPIGTPFPAFGLTGVMVAIAARGVSGSPAIDLVTRTYIGDPSIPSAWDTTGLIGTDKVFSSTSEDYNTGNLAWAPADVAFGQLGLWIPAVNANATFDVIVAAKY